MSKKPTWIEIIEKEIIKLRKDINYLAGVIQKMLEYEKLTEKLLEAHKDSEATLMALQGMRGSFDINKDVEKVRKYARKKSKSLKEAFQEMSEKNILPEGLRNFVKARKIIREML